MGRPDEEIKRLIALARGEEPGQRTTGNPKHVLASPDPVIMSVDEWRKHNAERQKQKETPIETPVETTIEAPMKPPDHRLAWFISLAVAVPLLFALTFDPKHASAVAIPWVFAGFLFPIHGAVLLLRRGVAYSSAQAVLICVSAIAAGQEFSMLSASALILVYLITLCESIYVMCRPTETSSSGPTSIAALKWTCVTILAVIVAVSFAWMNRLQFVTEHNNGKSRTRVYNRWSGEEIGSPKPWGL